MDLEQRVRRVEHAYGKAVESMHAGAYGNARSLASDAIVQARYLETEHPGQKRVSNFEVLIGAIAAEYLLNRRSGSLSDAQEYLELARNLAGSDVAQRVRVWLWNVMLNEPRQRGPLFPSAPARMKVPSTVKFDDSLDTLAFAVRLEEYSALYRDSLRDPERIGKATLIKDPLDLPPPVQGLSPNERIDAAENYIRRVLKPRWVAQTTRDEIGPPTPTPSWYDIRYIVRDVGRGPPRGEIAHDLARFAEYVFTPGFKDKIEKIIRNEGTHQRTRAYDTAAFIIVSRAQYYLRQHQVNAANNDPSLHTLQRIVDVPIALQPLYQLDHHKLLGEAITRVRSDTGDAIVALGNRGWTYERMKGDLEALNPTQADFPRARSLQVLRQVAGSKDLVDRRMF